MKLSKRLSAIASLVPKGMVVVDIGSDHALLPIYLIKHEISTKCYAVDNKVGPLSRAKDNIIRYDVCDRVIPILSDGFNELSDISYDVVSISGMGGDLIASILSNPIYKKDKILILEGNINSRTVREYLMNNNYLITDEEIVFEDNIYYFIEKAIPTNEFHPLTFNELEYGPINIKNKKHLLIDFINKKLNILNDGLDKSKDNQILISRIKKLEEVLNEIKYNNW